MYQYRKLGRYFRTTSSAHPAELEDVEVQKYLPRFPYWQMYKHE